MPNEAARMRRPELVVGLVGPIGCDITLIERELGRAFRQVEYKVFNISLSQSIQDLLSQLDNEVTTLRTLEQKINGGNRIRKEYGAGILAADSVRKSRNHRAEANNALGLAANDDPANYPLDSACYLIRQLKRPEEIELLQRIYGKQFVQVSIAETKSSRVKNLTQIVRRENPGWSDDAWEQKARELIDRDEDEKDDEVFGQKITDVFYRADVFISSEEEQEASKTTQRFVNALFGKNNISPTKDEFGSYVAKAASLRSVDLSRQVGAATITIDGDLISVGCNEVAKPFGGNYWDDDKEKARDIDRHGEANKEETSRIIHDFMSLLEREGLLREGRTAEDILNAKEHREKINRSLIGGITEYGRMVHAEMNAISDAARLGRSCKDATMYVTTFPCHTCAKHIVASGIRRVVFIEPYPKSRAPYLYDDAIAVDHPQPERVSFSHFVGISPRRYRDIFEKGKRRDSCGEIDEWYEGKCSPRIGNMEFDYTASELHAIIDNFPTTYLEQD